MNLYRTQLRLQSSRISITTPPVTKLQVLQTDVGNDTSISTVTLSHYLDFFFAYILLCIEPAHLYVVYLMQSGLWGIRSWVEPWTSTSNSIYL